jgi:CHRD domain
MRLRRLALLTAAAAVSVILVLPSVGFAARHPLFAALNGKNAIAQNGNKNAGDPNGAGSFSAVIKGQQLCYGLAVRDIEAPTEAHIHRGGKNRNGPDVVPLTAPEAGDPGHSSNCTTLDSNLIGQIRRNPRKFYVNVNTGEFRDGAIRGQLFSRGGP